MSRRASRSFLSDAAVFLGVAVIAFLFVHVLQIFHNGGNATSLRGYATRLVSQIGLPDLVGPELGLSSVEGVVAPPAPAARTHTVRSGETLSSIAQREGVSVTALMAANDLADPNRLSVGHALHIPSEGGAVRPVATSPRRAGAEAAPRFAHFGDWLRGGLGLGDEPDTLRFEERAIDELLAMASEELRAAHFEEAFHSAKAAERLLNASADPSALASRRARLEVVRATVRLATGDASGADRSLREALKADPQLQLDPETTSRKLLRALEAARASEQMASR